MLEIDPKEIIMNVHKYLITKEYPSNIFSIREKQKCPRKKDYLNKLSPVNHEVIKVIL